MRLIDDAEWVFKNAWSVRFNIAAAVLGGTAATLGVLAAKDTVTLPVGPLTLSIALGLTTAGASLAALAARFTHQSRPDADVSE